MTNLSSDDAFSWISDTERLSCVHDTYAKTPQTEIMVHFIYINIDSYISNIVSETLTLDCNDGGEESCISKEALLRLIQSNKTSTATSSYRLTDILLYNITVEPENIQSYTNADDLLVPCMKSIPLISEDISILQSIPVFHDINRLYFIYTESQSHTAAPISVLVNGALVPAFRKTKRVKFVAKKAARNTRRASVMK